MAESTDKTSKSKYAGTPGMIGITILDLHLSETKKTPFYTMAMGEVRLTRALSAENNEPDLLGVDHPAWKYPEYTPVVDLETDMSAPGRMYHLPSTEKTKVPSFEGTIPPL